MEQDPAGAKPVADASANELCNPGAELQQAFATSDLFLVTANAAHLGAFSADGSGACGPSATFANRINVGDWSFEAAVGQNNRYDDYADVMIVKGRRGPLWDPQNPAASLVASPDMWTQKTRSPRRATSYRTLRRRPTKLSPRRTRTS